MKRRRLKKVVAAVLTAGMAISLLAGCGSSGSGGGSAKSHPLEKLEDGTYAVSYASKTDPEVIDPAFDYNAGRFETLPNICEPLLKMDAEGKLEAGIASDWSHPDDLTYIYTIREDAKFSNGNPVTAEDVAFDMNRIMDPTTGSTISWLMTDVDTVTATGPMEVTVKLKQPNMIFQYLVATSVGQVYEKASCEEAGTSFGDEDHPAIGAGPYKVESWSRDEQLVLTKNEYYYDVDKLQVGQVTFKIYSDENAMLTAAKSGEVDIVPISNNKSLIENYSKIDFLRLDNVKGYASMGIFMNTAKAPCDNIDFRKALAYALDENAYTTSVYGDYAEVGNGMMFGSAGYGDDAAGWENFLKDYEYAYAYDMDKAKESLDASGIDPSTVTVSVAALASDSAQMKIAQLLQASCKEIGINVEIDKCASLPDYYSKIWSEGEGDYDVCVMTWGPDYPDAIGDIEPMFASYNDVNGGCNMSNLHDDTIDADIVAANAEQDPAKHMELVRKLSDDLAQLCTYKMTSYQDYIYFVNKQISYPWSVIPYWTVDLSKATISETAE